MCVSTFRSQIEYRIEALRLSSDSPSRYNCMCGNNKCKNSNSKRLFLLTQLGGKFSRKTKEGASNPNNSKEVGKTMFFTKVTGKVVVTRGGG